MIVIVIVTVTVTVTMISLRCFNATRLWAGTAREFGRAYRAGTAWISAHRAVLRPKGRHDARRGTARRRVWPGPGPLANYRHPSPSVDTYVHNFALV